MTLLRSKLTSQKVLPNNLFLYLYKLKLIHLKSIKTRKFYVL